MKVYIELPVDIDEPLSAEDRKKFQKYLQATAGEMLRLYIEQSLTPDPRMYSTICRFSFGKPTIKVE